MLRRVLVITLIVVPLVVGSSPLAQASWCVSTGINSLKIRICIPTANTDGPGR
jgi:hypothetical protein